MQLQFRDQKLQPALALLVQAQLHPGNRRVQLGIVVAPALGHQASEQEHRATSYSFCTATFARLRSAGYTLPVFPYVPRKATSSTGLGSICKK
jgi:hypothetical protein